MKETDDFKMLHELSKNYYQHQIGFTEYRALRSAVLDRIDEEYNGRKACVDDVDGARNSSLIKKALGLLRNDES